MFGWKGKKAPEDATWEQEPEEIEEDVPTWADGSVGPTNTVSRVFGRLPDDAEHEAHLAAAE